MAKRKRRALRGAGSSRLRTEPDGTVRYETRVYVGPVGHRRRVSYFAKTLAESQQLARNAQVKDHSGMPTGIATVKVKDYLARWIEDTAPIRARSAATLDGYQRAIVNHIIPALGDVPLSRLAPEHVASMLTTMEKKGLKPRTQRLSLAILRVALKPAERAGLIVRNVARLVEGPRVRRAPVDPLDAKETALLLKHLPDDEHGRALIVGAACGLRLGEVLGLERDAVDLQAGTLAVKTSLQSVSGLPEKIVEVKTDAGVRTVHLPAVAVKALRTQLELPPPTGPWASLVFVRSRRQRRAVGKWGTPLSKRQVWGTLQDALAAAGLDRKRVHDLRHGVASLQLAAGASLEEVRDLLGHSSIAVTSSHYAHLYDAARARMASNMDSLLANGGQKRGRGKPRRRGEKGRKAS